MTTDFRALCAELVEELHKQMPSCLYEGYETYLVFRARAALAQPEAEGPRPTRDEAVAVYTEVMAAHDCQTIGDMAEHFARAVLARWGRPAPPPDALAARPLLERVAAMGDCIRANSVGEISTISARASAWLRENPPGQPVAIEPRGCPMPGACSCVEPAPPADGEVAELVEWLCVFCANLTRAADLLTRLALQPVPVSERLPGPEDCDAEGRCWIHMPDIGTCPSWRLTDPRDIGPYHTHWLPAHALPTTTTTESTND